MINMESKWPICITSLVISAKLKSVMTIIPFLTNSIINNDLSSSATHKDLKVRQRNSPGGKGKEMLTSKQMGF